MNQSIVSQGRDSEYYTKTSMANTSDIISKNTLLVSRNYDKPRSGFKNFSNTTDFMTQSQLVKNHLEPVANIFENVIFR